MTVPAEPGLPRVLYVTYDGLLEPLGASQVLPYLRTARGAGLDVTVLSFEKEEETADAGREAALAAELEARGVTWWRRRYHRRPTLPATALDVWTGRRLARVWAGGGGGPAILHARGYLPALMAEAAAGGPGGPRLLFDMRGFWVDERIEGGYWAAGGLPARLGRAVERRVLAAADHLVLLTRRGAARVGDLLPAAADLPATVIPTCVDTARLRPAQDPAAARAALGLGSGPVLLHLGTLTGWYDGRATVAVARAFVERTGGRFVVLSRDVARARELTAAVGLAARIQTVSPEEVPRWLAAADAGLALVRPSPAKDASYPTRIGEYLAAGMAVLATPVGDLRSVADGRVVGLLEDGADPDAAAAWLAEAAARPDRVDRARAVALRDLSVEEGGRRFVEVYRSLAAEPAGRVA
jgi:glycosyltransferase involved in cell wall biosynthesis